MKHKAVHCVGIVVIWALAVLAAHVTGDWPAVLAMVTGTIGYGVGLWEGGDRDGE